jgi:hypothetical protein
MTKKREIHMPREQDRKKFVELAEKRVRRALKDLKLIGNLSNRSNYYYTDEDAKKICKVLQNAIVDVRERFERKGEDRDIEFSLD